MSQRRKEFAISDTRRISMAPSFSGRKPLPLCECPPDPLTANRLLNGSNVYLAAYRLGECSVLVTREFGKFHLSIAHRSRMPTWDEIAEAWYRVVPEAKTRTAALLLPPIHEYINLHTFCMQVNEIDPIPDTD